LNSVLEISIKDQSELPFLAKTILESFGHQKIILFDAPMGAGKTTIINTLIRFVETTSG
jgi:tRNA A37 threonylcarbamoyladenosine biosynthesis protein TsaE